MDIINKINILKNIGFLDVDTLILKKLENNKNITHIKGLIDFNIYQVLTYLIYSKINIRKKYFVIKHFNIKKKKIKKNNLKIYTNENGVEMHSNLSLISLYNSKKNNIRSTSINKTNNIIIKINNLNKNKKYLLFLPINAKVQKVNCKYFNCLNYLFFYVENQVDINIIFNNTLNLLISDGELVCIDNFNNDYNNIFKKIFTYPFKILSNKFNVSKCIAVWQREELLTSILNDEEKMKKEFTHCNILGYSNIDDINYIKEKINNKENTFYFYTPNDTLGLKWQHIIEFTKFFNIDNLLIQGSDDMILLDKININTLIKYDFSGQRQWYIKDYLNNKYYLIGLKKSISGGALSCIGAGRIIKINQIKQYNYNIFNPHSFKGLDRQLNTIALSIKNRFIGQPICCSLKGNHNCLNSLQKYIKSSNINSEIVTTMYPN